MTARTTITLPDTLAERLAKVKHRVNISGVCAQALETTVTDIENELDRLETLRQEVGDMDTLIDRLKEEKEGFMQKRVEQGAQYAKGWVSRSSYEDIKHWVSIGGDILPNLYVGEWNGAPPLPEDIIDDWTEMMKDRDDSRLVPTEDDEIGAFMEGFYTGLCNQWEMMEV